MTKQKNNDDNIEKIALVLLVTTILPGHPVLAAKK